MIYSETHETFHFYAVCNAQFSLENSLLSDISKENSRQKKKKLFLKNALRLKINVGQEF